MKIQEKSPAFGSYQTNFSRIKPHQARILTDIFQGNTDAFSKATRGTKVLVDAFETPKNIQLTLVAKPLDMGFKDFLRYSWHAVKSLFKGEEVFPAKKTIDVEFSKIGLVPNLEKALDGLSTVTLTEYGKPEVASKILAEKYKG